jgi:hypothetical protein
MTALTALLYIALVGNLITSFWMLYIIGDIWPINRGKEIFPPLFLLLGAANVFLLWFFRAEVNGEEAQLKKEVRIVKLKQELAELKSSN